jgi:hypothetical protein
MLQLQREGVYPSAFAAIRSPVLMLHGAVDAHPGLMIRASLEHQEWDCCGHYPWLEKAVCEDFFSTVTGWIQQQLKSSDR